MSTKLERLRWRNKRRDRVHPNWRRTAWNSGFVCAAAESPGTGPEGCTFNCELELHEPFGEQVPLAGEAPKFQVRVLLCKSCHRNEHYGRFSLKRANESILHLDLADEIDAMGGLAKWEAKYING